MPRLSGFSTAKSATDWPLRPCNSPAIHHTHSVMPAEAGTQTSISRTDHNVPATGAARTPALTQPCLDPGLRRDDGGWM